MSTKALKDLYVGSDYIPDEKMLRKTASHKLTPNIQNWPIEILKVLGEDYPWVTENVRPATVDLEKVDKEHGSGYGAVVVFSNSPPQKTPGRVDPAPKQPMGPSILLPFTVRNYQMSPLDIFVSGKKVLPLTKKRIEEEMMTSQIFQNVDKSKTPQGGGSLSQLSLPQDAAFRYGRTTNIGDEAGKTASVKTASRVSQVVAEVAAELELEKTAGAISTQDSMILSELLPTLDSRSVSSFSDRVSTSPTALAQFTRNKNVDILSRIIKARPITPDDQQNIARWAFPKNVLLFEKISAGRWKVTMMNDHYMVKDEVIATERTLIEQMSGISDIADKLWKTSGFIATVNHKAIQPVVWHDGAVLDTKPVAASGVYLVVMQNKTVEEGFAFESIIDYDGNRLPFKLWYDGDCFGIQERMEGEHLSKEWTHDEGFLKPGVWGTFLQKEENGETNAVMPFKILAIYADRRGYPETTCIRATDMYGHDVNFLIPRYGDVKWRSAVGTISAELGDPLGSRGYWVSKDTQFVTLGSQRVPIMENAREVAQGMHDTAISSFSTLRTQERPASALAVSAVDGGSTYRLEGQSMEPVTMVSGGDFTPLRAKWVLVMMGCSIETADAILQKAVANRRVIVMNLRVPKTEANIRIQPADPSYPQPMDPPRSTAQDEVIKISAILRKDVFKEAAYIRDKKSVDALLSLNFINPDNLIVFLKNLPKFREVEENLAKLLLMARFGLEAVPEQAVENALKNLNLVDESLELLSGVVGNQMSAHGDIEFEEQETPPGTNSTLE